MKRIAADQRKVPIGDKQTLQGMRKCMSKIIEMNHVTKTYRRKLKNGKGILKSSTYETKKAIKDISFQVEEGEMVGIVGLNGAGKSTLIKCMLGILAPDQGEAKLFGKNSFQFRKKNAEWIGANFGQKSSLVWDLPFLYSMELNKKIYRVSDEDYEKILEELDQFLEIKGLLKVPVRTMSLGQRMKCEFAVITLHSPKLLILDETTIGLDIVIKKKIEDYLKYINKTKNVTILFSTHDLAELERICDRLLIINEGEIILDDQVSNISALSRYSEVQIQFSEMFDKKIELASGLQITDCSREGIKIRIDRQMISEKEAMTELIGNMPVERISVETQSLEDFIYNLVQKNEIYREGECAEFRIKAAQDKT